MRLWRCRACGARIDEHPPAPRAPHACGLVHPAHPLASTKEGIENPDTRVPVRNARDETVDRPPPVTVDYPPEKWEPRIMAEGLGVELLHDDQAGESPKQ